jgi:hypothetical protein
MLSSLGESTDKLSRAPRNSREEFSLPFADHCVATHNDCLSSTHYGQLSF